MMIGMANGLMDQNIEVGVEKKVGTITIGGVTYDRYVKIVNFGAMPVGSSSAVGSKDVPHGISSFEGILSLNGMLSLSSHPHKASRPVPYPHPQNLNYAITLGIDDTNVSAYTCFDYSSYDKCLIAIEYYK